MDKPQLGQVFQKRYLVLSELGTGGSAMVYRAQQLDAERDVALKVLRDEKRGDKEAVGRFFREFRLLSTLSHANIMTVYNVALDDQSSPYAVCEFVQGETLRDILRTQGALPWERVVKIAAQICNAFQYAHEHGVVHRDLKPDNVMIDLHPLPDFVKVLDFGLSRSFVAAPAPTEKLTWTGQLVGSPHYMSPEQVGEKTDSRSDIYALGCLLFEMLSGEFLFDAESPVAILLKQRHEDPAERFASITQTLPESLCQLISRLLEKDPENRYQSMKDIEEELMVILKEPGKLITGTAWRRAAKKQSSGKKRVHQQLIIGAIVIFVLNLILFLFIQSGSNPSKYTVTTSTPSDDDPASVYREVKRLSREGNNWAAVQSAYSLLQSTKSTQNSKRLYCETFQLALPCVNYCTSEKNATIPENREMLMALAKAYLACSVAEKKFEFYSASYKIVFSLLHGEGDKEQIKSTARELIEQSSRVWGDASVQAIQAKCMAAENYVKIGDFKTAAEVLEKALKASKSAGVRERWAYNKISMQLSLASACAECSRMKDALQNLEEARKDFLQVDELLPEQRLALWGTFTKLYAHLNLPRESESLTEEELKRYSTDINEPVPGEMYAKLGEHYSARKAYNQAIDCFRKGLVSAEREKNLNLQKVILVSLEKVYTVNFQKAEAKEVQSKLAKLQSSVKE